MKGIKLSEEHEMRLGYYRYASTMFPNISYLVYDEDVRGLEGKLLEVKAQTEIRQDSRWYNGQDLSGKSLLYLTLGSYRDGLLDIQFLKFLEQAYPAADIDVVTHIDVFMLFQQFGFRGGWNKYPIPLEFAEKYDFIFSNEFMTGYSVIPGEKLIETYKSQMPKDFKFQNPGLSLSRSIKKVTRIENDSRLSIGIHVNSEDFINNYPAMNYKSLVELLLKENRNVILTGYPGKVDVLEDLDVENFIGRHTSILETLSVLSQVDLIITSDSFAARAGGALGKPTIVLLNTNDPDAYSFYTSLEIISSGDHCVPCYRRDKCPLGYKDCQAFKHDSVSPEKIHERTLKTIEKFNLGQS